MIKRDQILSLVFSLDGSPYSNVSFGSKDPSTLEYTLDGSPWWGHSDAENPCKGNIKRVLKVDWVNVKMLAKSKG